ncbi:MAG: hypothetical protein GY719_01320 [bacterium]|nr:hypothetical protein [bacterium]
MWLAAGAILALTVRPLAAAPAAPTNLVARPGNAQAIVTWTAVSGATGYNVYRGTTEGGPYGAAIATGVGGTSFTDSAAVNDTSYYYVATAVDGTGESAVSNEDWATPRAGTFIGSVVIGSSSTAITTTWTVANSPYVVTGIVEIRGTGATSNDRTSTLVIQSGVIVYFERGARLIIGSTNNIAGFRGRLQATDVTFTANRSGAMAGDWQGIRFDDSAPDGGSNNFLDNCVVEFAGADVSGAVVVNRTRPAFRNGTIVRDTSSSGIHVTTGAAATITDSEIEGGGTRPAVRVQGTSTLTLTGNTFRGGSFPVVMDANVVVSALAGNTLEGYALEEAGVGVGAGLIGSGSAQTRTWPGGDLAYIVLGDITVRGDAATSNDRTSTLIIGGVGSPATVRFSADTRLVIGRDDNTAAGYRGRLQATEATFTARSSSPTPGFWETIYFANSANDGGSNNFLDACVVEYGGGNASAAVSVNVTRPVLRNGTIVRHTSSGGVWISGGSVISITGGEVEGGGTSPAVRVLETSTLTLTGVTLRGGSFPVQIQPNVAIAALSGNTMEGYAVEQAGIAVDEGLIGRSSATQSRTWPGGDLPFIVLGDVTIRGTGATSNDRTSTLVIGGAGSPTTVRFAPDAGLIIGRDDNTAAGYRGALQAREVTFTSQAATPAGGAWQGLYFADSALDGASFLDACVVEGAGGGGSGGAVTVSNTSLDLRTGTIIRTTANRGLYLNRGSSVATMSGGEIEGGSAEAVRAVGFSQLTLIEVTLRGGSYPIQIQPNVVLQSLGGSTTEGYDPTQDGVAVEAGIMGSTSAQTRIWPGDLDYIIRGLVEVRGNAATSFDRTSTLRIGGEQPTEVRFDAGAELRIGRDDDTAAGFRGRLLANGVTFTANSTSPTPGFWNRLHFADSAVDGVVNNLLEDCEVSWGGGGTANGAIQVVRMNLTVRNTRVLSPEKAGIYIHNDSTVSITDSEIEGGSDAGVRIFGSSSLTMTGTVLRGGTYPVRMQPNVSIARFQNNVAEGYDPTRAGVGVDDGLIGRDNGTQLRTWPAGGMPYLIRGNIEVRGDGATSNDRTSTLIVGAGAILRFDAGTRLLIGNDANTAGGYIGKLQASGVTFTANTETPTPGFWGGIYFRDSTVADRDETYLDRCTVEWAGGGANGAVEVNKTVIGISETRILGTSSAGLYLTASSASNVTVDGGEIEGGSDAAIRVRDRGILSVSGATLRGGAYAIRMGPNSDLTRLSGNVMAGYGVEQAGIAVDAGIMGASGGLQTRVWPGGSLPYIVLGSIEVRGNGATSNDRTSTLILGADTQVRFNAGAQLLIGYDANASGGYIGKLQATGVVFTANSASPTPGFWGGIYFRDSTVADRRETYLDHCIVEWAGGGLSGAVQVNRTAVGLVETNVLETSSAGVYVTGVNTSTVVINGGEIEGGSDAAVRVRDRGRLFLEGAVLRSGGYPVRIGPNSELLYLRGNSMGGYAADRAGIAVDGGIMGASNNPQTRFWPGGDLPYIVRGSIEVRGNGATSNDRTSTLILGADTTVRFDAGTRLFIGRDDNTAAGYIGQLKATGVTFSSNVEVPVPGSWKGIYFRDTTVGGSYLDHCTVEWAGGGVSGSVTINRTSVVLRDTRVLGTASAGVYLTSGSVATITGGELEGGTGPAVRALNGSTITVSDTTLRGGTFPIGIGPNAALTAIQGNRLEGYPFEAAGIAVDPGIMGSSSGVQTRVWPADLPYIVLGDVSVRGTGSTSSDRTSTLLIQGGGEVRFNAGAGMTIGLDSGLLGFAGRLQATGVTFTANSAAPTPGFWKGLNYRDMARDSDQFLVDCTVEYGGYVSATSALGANITIHRSTPRLIGVTSRASSHDGILVSQASPAITAARLSENVHGLRLVSSGTPRISGSDIESNSSFGIRNQTGTTIFAGNNWWGDASGPLDDSDDTGSGGFHNPGGLGDRVSDAVDFNPWLELSARPPAPPAVLAVEPGGGQASLAWHANAERDLAGYEVFRRQPPAATEVRVNPDLVPPSTDPAYVDTGLVNQTEYCYRVRAVDTQGRDSSPSREVCATPKNDLEAPVWSDLVGLQFVEGGDGTAVLRFEPATDAQSGVVYNVYYSTLSPIDPSSSATRSLLGATPAAGSSGYSNELTITGLTAGRWYFTLQAEDADGNTDSNDLEVSAIISPSAGSLAEQGPWTGATLDGVLIDARGHAVLDSGVTEGRITSGIVELPPGASLAAFAWNVLEPVGTAVDTIPGGLMTLEVRAADAPASIGDARCAAPAAGLSAWWPGNGNPREIQGGRDSILRNGASFAVGLGEAQAFSFDGANDYVDVTINVSETAYTMSLWFRTTCSSCGLFSVDVGSLGSSGNDRHVYLTGGNLCARVWNNEVVCTSGTTFSDGAWHHVAHVFGGGVGGQRIFVDGVERASGSKASSNFSGQTGVNIGFSNDAGNDYFNGLVQHVAVFDAALDAAAIEALHRAGGAGMCQPDGDGDGVADPADACPASPAFTAVNAAGCPAGECFEPPAGAVAWWRAEGDGVDAVGGNDATLAGGASFAEGMVGDAFRFDGSNDRGQVADFGSFTNMSTQMWIYREGATTSRESIISYKEGDGANCGMLTVLNENGSSQRPRQFVQVNGTWRSVVADSAVPLGAWTHVAGTYDGTAIRLFVDGVLVAAGFYPGAMTQCTQNTGIGTRASFNRLFLPGRVDELAVFDRPLAAVEIQALAEAADAGMCTAPAPPPSGPPGTPQIEEGWVRLTHNQIEDLPDGRYVQFRATLRGDVARSPELRSVTLGY